MWKSLKRFSSQQIIITGFAALILLGALLLTLPFSTRDGQGASLSDALFTAVSASCVTGLIVQDTASYWSGFGQAVILLLIQVGGMGFVTFSVLFATIFGQQISLKQRGTMQDAISAQKLGSVVQLTGMIFRMTMLFELTGAALFALRFCPVFGLWRGLWYGLFHGVSAFCNAGFDLMGETEAFSSLTAFPADPLVNLTAMAMILLGGIGFLTWEDVGKFRLHVRRYRMQTKVVLVTYGFLILLPFLYFLFFEFTDLPPAQRIWGALFQSVTTRTAGFNTLDLTRLSDAGVGVMIPLMLTGGSPGSTAGGAKVTTLAVLASTAVAVFRRNEDTEFFGRRISPGTVRSAAAIATLYLFLFSFGGLAISCLEDLPLLPCLFESASAVGTVGLTLGLTPGLGQASRVILMLLMYAGRVGALTLMFAAMAGSKDGPARLPQESLMVG